VLLLRKRLAEAPIGLLFALQRDRQPQPGAVILQAVSKFTSLSFKLIQCSDFL